MKQDGAAEDLGAPLYTDQLLSHLTEEMIDYYSISDKSLKSWIYRSLCDMICIVAYHFLRYTYEDIK